MASNTLQEKADGIVETLAWEWNEGELAKGSKHATEAIVQLVESECQKREQTLLATVKPFFLRPRMYFGDVNQEDFDKAWGVIASKRHTKDAA
jgi:hypothetical protein